MTLRQQDGRPSSGGGAEGRASEAAGSGVCGGQGPWAGKDAGRDLAQMVSELGILLPCVYFRSTTGWLR